MNTPTRPLEASGTSGEKAEMNGVVNLSVLDGWWLEGYREGAGWALTEKRTYQNQGYQDQLDAATIYGLLENEIIPLYYNKGKKDYSEGWVKVIKNSIAQIVLLQAGRTLPQAGSKQQPARQGNSTVEGNSSRALGRHPRCVERHHHTVNRNGDWRDLQREIRHRRTGSRRRYRLGSCRSQHRQER